MSKISIIVCTRRAQLPAEMQQNIAATIGCDYELVVIDNSKNKYSIFETYNIGVSRATGDLLCFVHDDVLFRTDKWGAIIGEIFTDETIGMVGFAGAHFLPAVPMYWSESPIISEYNLHNDRGTVKNCFQQSYFKSGIIDAIACDGFCFFIPHYLFDRLSFDEKTYQGFHMYDMDICMQVLSIGKRLILTNRILLEHAWSESLAPHKKGMDLFKKNLVLFYGKWQNKFPLLIGVDLPTETFRRMNRLCEQAHDAKVARNSVSYKLGRFILSPVKWMQSKLK